MKKGFVRGALLLLLAMLLSLLAACSSPAPDTPPAGTTGTETETGTDTGTEEPSVPVPVIENGEARFSIVFDENAQQETKDSVTSLYQALKKKVTGTLDVASSDAITYDAERQEILVGRISYPESEAALSRIGYGDWIIAMIGNKLVVNSYNRAAMVTAISELVQVLKGHTAGDGSVSLPSDFVMTDTRDAASDTIPAFFEGCRVVKGHTGQKFYLRNAVVEILYSLDNYLPEVLSIFNNSSLVFSVEAEGERAIFMGDASDEAAKILKDNYGTLLRCDILQLAHHGLRNGHGTKMPNTVALYQLMRPEVVLWPSTEEHYLTSAEGDIKYSIGDFAWNKEALKSARECYLAGGDRILILELPYRAFSAYDFNPDDNKQGTTAKEHPSGSDHLDYGENGDTLTVDWND